MADLLKRSNYLPTAAYNWVQHVLGADANIQKIEPLLGGVSTAMHKLWVVQNGRTQRLVLRRFTNADWLAMEPDLAAHEASSLEAASQAAVATPELIAFDEMGAVCDVPAVLMSVLPGRVELAPEKLNDWLYQMAAALVAIHETPAPNHVWAYYRYNAADSLRPPAWTRNPAMWEKAIHIIQETRPYTSCFIHRDYHPTNILWEEGKLSGVVDWVNACQGPVGIDVGHCRLNLVGLFGVVAADAFLEAYAGLAGGRFKYAPYWDLVALGEMWPGWDYVYRGWTDLGATHLTTKLLRKRTEAYLESLLARAK